MRIYNILYYNIFMRILYDEQYATYKLYNNDLQ